jgi:acyl-CoA hydrolase
MDERIQKSETRLCKLISPKTLNDHDTLFGGTAIQWMDEVAYITATRFSRKKMVTVSVDEVNFLVPIYSGTIVEIIGKVSLIKNVKIKVHVEVYVEEMHADNKQKAINALFTFAAIDNNNKPIQIT